MAGTWERCVREVTLSADPDTVGNVGVGWENLGAGLRHLRDALVGRLHTGPIPSGVERPHSGGLPDMLADWKGSGGDAYREHLSEIGKQIEELILHASNVSGALSRIESDIRTTVASIPIPLMDDFGLNEWSLPNGTALDDASGGESASGFLAALRKDYQDNPASYADGAFRDKADDLEATMKIDGRANDQERGGFWDTSSHLDNWYRDNQVAANGAMSPLPKAVETERPRLVVPPPDGDGDTDGYRDDNRNGGGRDLGGGGNLGTGGVGGGGGGIGGGGAGSMPGLGSIGGGGGGGGGAGFGGGGISSVPPSTGGDFGGGAGGVGGIGSPGTGAGYGGGGTPDYGTGLAGAGAPTIGGGTGLGGGLGGPGSGGLGGAGGGPGGGLGGGVGSAGGIGGGGLGAAGAMGVGGVPGMVGGGNGKVPPMTSAASALRNAAGAGAGAGGLRGAGMMGGGMMGGGMMGGGMGGHGAGQGGTEHSSWLTEDDDPWGAGDGASPGILR